MSIIWISLVEYVFFLVKYAVPGAVFHPCVRFLGAAAAETRPPSLHTVAKKRPTIVGGGTFVRRQVSNKYILFNEFLHFAPILIFWFLPYIYAIWLFAFDSDRL